MASYSFPEKSYPSGDTFVYSAVDGRGFCGPCASAWPDAVWTRHMLMDWPGPYSCANCKKVWKRPRASFTSVGGYPILYVDAENGDEFCGPCADLESTETYDDGSPVRPGVAFQSDVYWEGPPVQCTRCGKDITSAYGDPNGEESAQ